MINTIKNKKSNNMLFLFVAVLIVFFTVFVALFFCDNQTPSSASATSSVTFKLGSTKEYNSGKDNTQVNPASPALLNFDGTSDNTKISDYSTTRGRTTASFSNDLLTISQATNNVWFEAMYADISAEINVPAWYEYKVTYTFDGKIVRTNTSAPNYYGFEIYDFDSDEMIGEEANFVFDTNGGGATTPTNYVKTQKHDSAGAGDKPIENTYTVTYTYTNTTNQAKLYKNNFGTFAYKRATSSNATRIVYGLSMSATVAETKLSITKPTADTRTFEYTGNEIIYNIGGWDANKMALTDASDDVGASDAIT